MDAELIYVHEKRVLRFTLGAHPGGLHQSHRSDIYVVFCLADLLMGYGFVPFRDSYSWHHARTWIGTHPHLTFMSVAYGLRVCGAGARDLCVHP